MKIGIVLGSIRDHRKGESVARWVLDNCPAREGVDVEIIDVSGFDLPLLSDETLPAMRGGSYDDPRVQSFADRIASCDGYIFVTAEYNHGIPGAFKNAIDLLGPELFGKPVASSPTGRCSEPAPSSSGASCLPTSTCSTSATR